MKKLLVLVLSLLLTFTLFSCQEPEDTPSGDNQQTDKFDENKVLENSNFNYYILSSSNNLDASQKMTAIAASDAKIKGLGHEEGLQYLYYIDVEFTSAKLTFEFAKEKKDHSQVLYANDFPSSSSMTSSILAYNVASGKFTLSSAGKYRIVSFEYKTAIAIGAIYLGPVDEPIDIPDDYAKYQGGINLATVDQHLQSNVQNGLILHAFNWGYRAIKENMAKIAYAGFSTIQTSPVQQPKDYNESYPTGWAEQWSKLYQPLSFSFAREGWLGTKEEFKDMCDEAHKYGIKIIVDIVANHMANNIVLEKDKTNTTKMAQLYGGSTVNGVKLPGIQEYEPDLYKNQSQYVHAYQAPGDGSAQSVCIGNNQWPDLNTGNSYVQGRVISLLKECIDCGADGFRFDAAKHIETPDDGSVASNFWPNVLNAARSHAGSKELYFYGEILNTPGNGRSYGSYTKYMSITDNKTGNAILQAVLNGNASGAASSNYQTGQAANKIVLWAESHDTYANTTEAGATTKVSVQNVNKAWALVGSRKDATALYLSRPTNLGQAGKLDFTNVEVQAVNLFHNYFVGASEHLSSSGNFAIVERKLSSGETGMVIVNCNGTTASINLSANLMADGTYYDQITGNQFTVSGKKVTGNMGSTGIVVLQKENPNLNPVVNVSQNGGIFKNSLNLQIKLEGGAKSALVMLNGEVLEELTSDGSVTISGNNGDSFEVTIISVNGELRNIQNYQFIRLDSATSTSVIVKDVPDKYFKSTLKIWAWVWEDGGNGRAIAAEIVGSYVLVNGKKASETNILLVTTDSSQTVFEWKNAAKKTIDIVLNEDNIASAPESSWGNP